MSLLQKEPSSIKLWTTDIKKVYLGSTLVRPTSSVWKTFTITWTEQSDMSSWWTYSDDAAWLTAWSTDFDEFFWYSVVALKNDWTEYSEYTQTQSWGYWKLSVTSVWNSYNIMIKFPLRWIKMTKSWSSVTLSITDEPNKPWYQYYAHTKGTAIKDNLYLWAYKMSSWYVSKYSKALLTWQTRAEVRNWITSTYWSWTWYSQITWYPRQYVNALYMMKYWNPDCRNVVGRWYSYSRNSGSTNTYSTYSTTDATYWALDYWYTQMRLFWLEDRWGNANEWLDWCWLNSSSQLTVDKTNSIFQDSAYTTNLWTSPAWYIWWIDGSNDGMFLSKTSLWDSTTYYCSVSYLNSPQNWLFASWPYNWDFYANAFYMWCWQWYYPIDQYKYWSRLMYL